MTPEKRVRILVAKPGLDGHDVGAKIVVRALMDAGFDVIYTGLRKSPEQIVRAACDEDANVLGLSILSGSHVSLVRDVVQKLREAGMGEVPVVVGGIIPAEDVNVLKQCGAAAIYTPKDFQLNEIMTGIVDLVDQKVEVLAEADVPVPPLEAKEKLHL